jgi:hypothetical protein
MPLFISLYTGGGGLFKGQGVQNERFPSLSIGQVVHAFFLDEVKLL